MNKEKFLKELEKRLSILNEKEKNDIIEEYKSTIEEKVKNGQKETEAVKDFGNIDELVEEILQAYKINPKYNKASEFQKFLNDGEAIIKEGADKLASVTKEIATNFKENNENINLSLVFEILIKVFFTMIIIGVLKIPFMLFKHLGYFIFETMFTPLDVIIKVLWMLFLKVIYLAVIVIIISKIFKEYFVKNEKDSKNNKNSETKNVNMEKKDINKKVKKNSQSLTSVLFVVVKVWVVLFILIPLIFTDTGFIGATLISLYYWIQGINLLGLTSLFLGLSLVFIWFTKLIGNILENKKNNFYLLIIGIALVIVGGFLFVTMILNIDYIDNIPENYELYNMTNVYKIDKKTYIETHNNEYSKKIIDESLEDNTFKINIRYDDKLYDIKINKIDNYQFDEDSCEEHNLCGLYNYFEINKEEKDEIKSLKMAYNNFINDLKDNRIYSYNKLYNPVVEVSANSKTLKLIEID